MDTTTIIVIVAVLALVGFYLYNRSRPAPRGTYDDKDTRSSGSIGGGTRAHDDPNVRSSGSIGGGTRANNSPAHSSGGSIGGGPTSRPPREERVTTRPELREDNDQFNRAEPVRGDQVRTRPALDDDENQAESRLRIPPAGRGLNSTEEDRLERERAERQRKDSEEFRSGGSFGSSSS